jgi:hypothetical protein
MQVDVRMIDDRAVIIQAIDPMKSIDHIYAEV